MVKVMSSVTYDFGRLSVALADSKPVMRRAVKEVLSTFGFAQVHELPDGLRAIEFLGKERGDPNCSDGRVDLIFADLHLERLDGTMLARWLRRHECSPDRFMPFIMLGVGELHDVALARDAGISEFVIEPCTVDALGSRIISTIDKPRQYVCTQTYFGPDRRNRPSSHPPGERREIENATSAESSDGPPFLTADGPPVRYYTPRNRLRERVGGRNDRAGAPIAPGLIHRARERIAHLERDFIDWTDQAVGELDGLRLDMASNPMRAAISLRRIHRIARALHSQANLFEYPLIAEFSHSLAEVSGAPAPAAAGQLDLVRIHADCIGAVARDRLRGDGGEAGADLRHILETAKRRCALPQSSGGRSVGQPH